MGSRSDLGSLQGRRARRYLYRRDGPALRVERLSVRYLRRGVQYQFRTAAYRPLDDHVEPGERDGRAQDQTAYERRSGVCDCRCTVGYLAFLERSARRIVVVVRPVASDGLGLSGGRGEKSSRPVSFWYIPPDDRNLSYSVDRHGFGGDISRSI